MPLHKKTATDSSIFRELTEKELNEIMKSVGDQARAQTIEQKERMKSSLRKEIELARTRLISDENKNY
ncbi:MAG: hypothetical protein JW927_08530 [Deltaproteobacteria bacterium]|nr:hypothetical protein [Deltaproteobacteria bacterium]